MVERVVSRQLAVIEGPGAHVGGRFGGHYSERAMSDKKDAKPAAPAAEAKKDGEGEKKGGGPIKLIGIVGVAMAIEAGALFMVFKSMKPKEAHADTKAVAVLNPEGEKLTEVKAVEDKFQNLQTGKVWFWDVAVYVQTKQKNAEIVKKRLEQRTAEISEEVSRIIARAQHAQLKEPDRQTLSRQVTAVIMKIFEGVEERGTGSGAASGGDGHGGGGHAAPAAEPAEKGDKNEPLVERVIISKCRGLPFE